MPWFRDQYAEAVWECASLRPNEKLVALVYADHAGDPKRPGNDVAWVVWRRLSERTGIRSKTAISNALKGLQASGWMVLKEGKKQHYSPRYQLVIPESEVGVVDVWGGEPKPPEVAQVDNWPVDNRSPEVHETDLSPISEVAAMDNSASPVVHETTPEVAETTSRGSSRGPDFSNNLSTTNKPGLQEPNHRPRKKPACVHRWTKDGDCVRCGRHEPCPGCRQLAHVNDTIRCHEHQEAS